MLFKVTKQYLRGADQPLAAFNDTNDARIFINAKLVDDERLKVKVIYRLWEGMDLLEEHTESDTPESASGGSQQKSSFQPTPFNTSPRPSGLPQNWLKDEDDSKK